MILTKHRKNKKSNQFSIYLRNYLLFDETTKRRLFVNDDKNLNFKLFVDNDLHDSNVDIVVFFVIIVNFVIFIFFHFFSSSLFFFSFAIFFVAIFFLFFHFHFLFFNKIRIECDFRRNTILSVDAKLFFCRKTKIDRDDDAKTFKRASEDIVHIFINITLDRTFRDVDLKKLKSSIKTRQNIYKSTNDIFKSFHEIRESIELTSNDEKIFLLVRMFAFSLFHQFSKRQHFAHSRDATNVILSEDNDNRDLLENLSRDDIKNKINLHWLIIDTSSTNQQHFYNHTNNIKTFATIADDTTHVENAFEKKVFNQKLDTFLTAFRFRVLLENDLKKLRQRLIKFDNVEISRRKILHKRHHENFKKEIFEQTKKIDKENNKIEKRNERKVWSKTKKKNLLLNRRFL